MPHQIELDPSLAEDFVTEASEYLDNIDQKLLDLESQLADQECVDDIFRAIHTIKGLAGFLELDLINELSHRLETLLDEIRKEKREATQEVIDCLFQGVDLIRKLIDDVEQTLVRGETVYAANPQLVDETGALLDHLGMILDGRQPMAGETKGKNKALKNVKDDTLSRKENAETSSKHSKKKTHKKSKIKQVNSNATAEKNSRSAQQTDQQANATESEKPTFEIPKKLYDDFQIEAEEHLDICDQSLVTLDKHRDSHEAINNLFRSIHTIKGSASYLGLKSISAFTHALEELLDIIRAQDSFQLADELMDLFFEAIDCLKRMIQAPTAPDILRQSHDLLNKILTEKETLQQNTANDLLHDQSKAKKTSPEHIFLESARQFVESYKTCIDKLKEENPPKSSTLDVLDRVISSLESSATYMGYSRLEKIVELSQETVNSLKNGEISSPLAAVQFLEDNLKEITSFLNEIERGISNKKSPALTDSDPEADTKEPNYDQEKHVESTAQTRSKPASSVEATKPIAEPELAVSVNPQNAPGNGKAPTSNTKTMRIDQRLLDVFMNLVGELIVTRNAFGHIIRHLENHAEDRDKAMKDLRAASQSITRISEEMQRVVMDMRMVPMRNVFQKFPRMVRDLTRKTNKTIDLVIQGEETEIDKGIAEVIGDPLIHIIRNAVDHGIEPPEVRRKAGKPEKGTIILRAAHEGNYIVIEVIDDGKGLDPDLLLQKAIEKGLTTPEKAKHLSQEEIYNFIFMPGFSTAKEVTDISGRGVGMDVVRTNLRKLKGNIRVSSEVGQGTHVRLEVPLTLAIIEALLVGVGEDIFAIPIEAVTETVKLKREELHSLMAKKAFSLRGEIICVEFLSELLNISTNGHPHLKDRNDIPILIIQAGGERLGLAVDEMYRQEEIVVKPLADYLADLPGLAGASIFGDGKAILILDPEELVSMATESMAA